MTWAWKAPATEPDIASGDQGTYVSAKKPRESNSRPRGLDAPAQHWPSIINNMAAMLAAAAVRLVAAK